MPYLGDYLGQLLSELVIARAQADQETLRLAEYYAGHPHLKNFPIPHLRLPTVTLDIVYAVEASAHEPEASATRGKVDLNAMRSAYRRTIEQVTPDHGVALDAKTWASIDKALEDIERRATMAPSVPVAVRATVLEMTRVFMAEVKAMRLRHQMEGSAAVDGELESALNREAMLASMRLRSPAPRVNVVVTKRELMEVKDPGQLSKVRLTIAEQGQEWTVIETDGTSTERLVPE